LNHHLPFNIRWCRIAALKKETTSKGVMAKAGRFHGKRVLLICENSVVLVQKVPLTGQLLFGNVYVEWSDCHWHAPETFFYLSIT
jgi:hypothetical protein